MRCGTSRELISQAFDSDLNERQRQELVDHLGACDECRRHHEILERGRDLLHRGMVEPPENLEWKVQLGIQRALRDRARTPEPRFGRAFWGRTAASAAAVAVVVVVVGSLFLPDGPFEGRVDPGLRDAAPVALADGSPVLEPDLSGARPVTDFEIDAFSDDYGIRTVADQGAFGSLGQHYPVGGRRFAPSTSGWSIDGRSFFRLEEHLSSNSQVLHLRIVRPTLRRDGSNGSAVTDSQTVTPRSRP